MLDDGLELEAVASAAFVLVPADAAAALRLTGTVMIDDEPAGGAVAEAAPLSRRKACASGSAGNDWYLAPEKPLTSVRAQFSAQSAATGSDASYTRCSHSAQLL